MMNKPLTTSYSDSSQLLQPDTNCLL